MRGEPFADEDEVLLHLPDGAVRHIVLSGGVVRDAQGRVALAMNLYRDVTQVRELEQVREQCMSLITHDLRSTMSAAMYAAEIIKMGRPARRPPGRGARRGDMERRGAAPRDLEPGEQRAQVRGGRRAGRLTVEKTSDRAAVAVHNEGPPIAPEDQARLFAPFVRTRAAVAGGQRGWGLGLTFVHGCAEAHGGRVTLESSAERGTTFTLELPLDARSYQQPG